MEQIAAGKGARPRPFMLAGKAAAADAVWHSNRAPEAPTLTVSNGVKDGLAKSRKRQVQTASRMPQFIAPQLCKRVSRPPSGGDWVHEIKLDGYRIQLRVAGRKAVMRTRKGLDWTSDFTAIAEAAVPLEDCILDGEVVALDKNGAPDFAALQAALSEDRSKDLIYFVFDLLYLDGEDLRPRSLVERKSRLRELLERIPSAQARIKFVDHLSEPGDAVLESACRLSLEGIISKRASAPYRSGRTESWMKSKCRGGQEVVIGGWSGSSHFPAPRGRHRRLPPHEPWRRLPGRTPTLGPQANGPTLNC
jgi:bifunctional non-homologous end joining protein LigD